MTRARPSENIEERQDFENIQERQDFVPATPPGKNGVKFIQYGMYTIPISQFMAQSIDIDNLD